KQNRYPLIVGIGRTVLRPGANGHPPRFRRQDQIAASARKVAQRGSAQKRIGGMYGVAKLFASKDPGNTRAGRERLDDGVERARLGAKPLVDTGLEIQV